MKKLPIPFLLFLFLISQPLFSQVDMGNSMETTGNNESATRARVFESDESMSQGIQNALIVELESNDAKLVENVWKDFIKNYGGKTKKSKGGKDEFLTSGAEIVGINGVKPIEIYTRTTAQPDGTSEHRVWFNLGEEYLESNRKDQFKEAESLLLKFAHEVKVEQTRNELKETEKELKRMEVDLKQLERQHEGYHKDIENYERRIEEAKENIILNDQQQEDTRKKIELQKMLVDEIDRRLKDLKKY